MRLYKQTAKVPDDDHMGVRSETLWSGSQAEAASQRAAWVKSGVKRADITTEEVEVPTNKQGLIGFLNQLSS